MQDSAYDAMQQMQSSHWWWRGMFHLYHVALQKFLKPTSQPRRVIDIGCGFGANLPVLNPIGEVVGVDVSLEALRAIPERPRLGLVVATADALPFKAGTFDVVALLAVIEHVEDDQRVVAETYRIAKPGALQILLTSAFMQLWSHHDVANEHKRRYLASQLNQLLQRAGWDVRQTSYVNSVIFPGVALIRWLQRLTSQPGHSKYDMGINIELVNKVLVRVLALETWIMVQRGKPLPFGVNLFSVGERE